VRSHRKAGHMTASDQCSSRKNLLQVGGHPHMRRASKGGIGQQYPQPRALPPLSADFPLFSAAFGWTLDVSSAGMGIARRCVPSSGRKSTCGPPDFIAHNRLRRRQVGLTDHTDGSSSLVMGAQNEGSPATKSGGSALGFVISSVFGFWCSILRIPFLWR
jgi:hypothetical protein